MRLINYICRFPVAIILCLLVGIFSYLATIFGMLFFVWDLEFESLKEVHKDIGDVYLEVMGLKP